MVKTVEANPAAYGFTAAAVMPDVPEFTTGSAFGGGFGRVWLGQFCATQRHRTLTLLSAEKLLF